MVGRRESAKTLNDTLLHIIKLFNDNNIDKWFVCYGTLLGLVRENSCIENDDDIDFIVHKDKYDDIAKLLQKNKFSLCVGYGVKNSKFILKTNRTSKYSSIDIYFAEFNNDSVIDLWCHWHIKDCYLDIDKQTFIEKSFNGEKIYYPNNYERILTNIYGDWHIKKSKGQYTIPKNKIA